MRVLFNDKGLWNFRWYASLLANGFACIRYLTDGGNNTCSTFLFVGESIGAINRLMFSSLSEPSQGAGSSLTMA
jgi:hypothetical protein